MLCHANIGTDQQQVDAETALLSNPPYYQYDLNLADVAEVWRRGSVIGSWLLDLTASALLKDPALSQFEGRVSDLGEGQWTISASIDEGVPEHVLTAALYERFASRGEADFANRPLSAMRFEFGVHLEKSEEGSEPPKDGMHILIYSPTREHLRASNPGKSEHLPMRKRGMQKPSWWQRLHWPEYGSELLGTAFLVFIALSAVTFNFGLGSPLAVVLPKSSVRRLITGLILASSGPIMAISPLGKLSGSHLNPAVSLAFWLQGKMHPHDLAGYITSQLLGAVIGAGVAVLVWRERAASVHNGVTAPGMGYPIWSVFLIEMGFTCLLVLAIFLFLSSHRLMRWTPFMTWLLVAFIYWQAAPISGSSLNPARSFGPALVSWFWHDQWLYYLASPIGALLAVGLFRSLGRVGIHDVLTAKLFHTPRYRCIFKHVKASLINTDQEGKLLTPRERD